MTGALPVVRISVDGKDCEALLDAGCSRYVAHASVCRSWSRRPVSVTTVSGERYWCEGTGVARICLRSGESVSGDVLVAARRPLGFDFILGMNGANELGGVTVRSNDCVRFGVETRVSGAAMAAAVPDDRERCRADVAEVSGVTALAPAPSDRRIYDVEMAAVSDVFLECFFNISIFIENTFAWTIPHIIQSCHFTTAQDHVYISVAYFVFIFFAYIPEFCLSHEF